MAFQLLMEGLIYSLIILLACIAAKADGAVNAVFLYEPEVQKRVAELGLIREEDIKRNGNRFKLCAVIPSLVFILYAVYGYNGARGFREGFLQLVTILLIEGLFDRLFIDWYWVNHTKDWIIPGTEDLMPYICGKPLKIKWLTTLVGYPVLAALIAGIAALILR